MFLTLLYAPLQLVVQILQQNSLQRVEKLREDVHESVQSMVARRGHPFFLVLHKT
jgi:hypothetical protein